VENQTTDVRRLLHPKNDNAALSTVPLQPWRRKAEAIPPVEGSTRPTREEPPNVATRLSGIDVDAVGCLSCQESPWRDEDFGRQRGDDGGKRQRVGRLPW
jgi:hypothetical protein